MELSPETLAALRSFAIDSGCAVDEDRFLETIQQYFDLEDKEETFDVSYVSDSGEVRIDFSVKGLKKELGQTLSSTGLTIWRAAEHLCRFIVNNPFLFKGKTVCELGAGLGLVSILLGKTGWCSQLVATDGDDETMALLDSNIFDNSESRPIIESCKLFWGEHSQFLERYPQKFDLLIGADIIYEEEQIPPLFSSVSTLLAEDGKFILAYARRNVPIDKVIQEAERMGFATPINLDSGIHGMEPIYLFEWKKD